MGAVTWTETFKGWLTYDHTDFNQALLEGRRLRSRVCARLTLWLDDAEATAPKGRVTSGYVDWDGFEGRMDVEDGRFELFRPVRGEWDLLHLRMRYRVLLRTAVGHHELTLVGFKLIENDPGYDSWADTTTLFTRIYKGSKLEHPDDQGVRGDPGPDIPNDSEDLLASGVLTVSLASFLRGLPTFRGSDGAAGFKSPNVRRYQATFLAGVARAYIGPLARDSRPSFPADRPTTPWKALETSDWHAVAGKPSLERRIFPYPVEDLDFPLSVQRLRRKNTEAAGRPVLLIPGSGVRAEMLYGQPVGVSIAEYLMEHGYDVWVQSWRASIDLPDNSYTLDQAARIDHPAAVDLILRKTGVTDLKAVVHCQGSVSFVMAAAAGFLKRDGRDQVSHVVSSAVSLFPEVTFATWAKQRVALPALGRLLPWADAQWGIRPQTPAGAAFAANARLMERRCGNAPCQLASFMYGSGWDVLLRHWDDDDEPDPKDPHIEPEVHAWSARELGFTPLSLIKQVAESSRHGHIVPAEPRDFRTPPSYVAGQPQTRAKFTFIAGDHNRMFRWQGQKRASEFFNQFPGGPPADFVPLPGYGHLDTFWGKNAAEDVFPHILAGLRWDGSPSTRPSNNSSHEPIENWAPRHGLLTDWVRACRAVARVKRAAKKV